MTSLEMLDAETGKTPIGAGGSEIDGTPSILKMKNPADRNGFLSAGMMDSA